MLKTIIPALTIATFSICAHASAATAQNNWVRGPVVNLRGQLVRSNAAHHYDRNRKRPSGHGPSSDAIRAQLENNARDRQNPNVRRAVDAMNAQIRSQSQGGRARRSARVMGTGR